MPADSQQEAVLVGVGVRESWEWEQRYIRNLAADTGEDKWVARTAPEGHMTAEEGQVESTTAVRIVHSLGREQGEEAQGGHRRPAAGSRVDTEGGTAGGSGSPEGMVQAGVERIRWVAALGEDKGRQEDPMRFAEPEEEDTAREVGHIELSPVPGNG
jgi:hypothetical protein